MKAGHFFIIFGILCSLSATLAAGDCCKPFKKVVCADGSIVSEGGHCGVSTCARGQCACKGGCKQLGPIKPFDILGVRKIYGYHYALALNGSTLAHNTKSQIKCQSIEEALSKYLRQGRVVKLTEYQRRLAKVSPKPPRDILTSVQKDIGRVRYCLLYNNCEHFVTRWVFGMAFSGQTESSCTLNDKIEVRKKISKMIYGERGECGLEERDEERLI